MLLYVGVQCSVSVFSVLSNMQMAVFSIERVTDDNCGHARAGTHIGLRCIERER